MGMEDLRSGLEPVHGKLEEMETMMREMRGMPQRRISDGDGKVVFRAVKIEKRKQRAADTDGHEVDEVFAEGGVKIRPKLRDFSQILVEQDLSPRNPS